MDLFDMEEASSQNQRFVRVKELESLITRYQNSYYNGEAEIADSEFDKLWDELKELDPSNPAQGRCRQRKLCQSKPCNAHGQSGKSRKPGAVHGMGKQALLRRISCGV